MVTILEHYRPLAKATSTTQIGQGPGVLGGCSVGARLGAIWLTHDGPQRADLATSAYVNRCDPIVR